MLIDVSLSHYGSQAVLKDVVRCRWRRLRALLASSDIELMRAELLPDHKAITEELLKTVARIR